MTNQEIEQMILKEGDAFNAAVYDGHPLPGDIIAQFKIAVMKLPPAVHKLGSKTIERIVNKKVKQLTNLEVPTVLNTITLLPFCDLYKDLETAIIKNKEIEEAKAGYNFIVHSINKELEIKKQNLLTLINKETRPNMKIAQA